MQFTDKLATPGEHSLQIPQGTRTIEAVLSIPNDSPRRYVALIGHPHSLQGGTMANKVVTTMAKTFKELQIASLRFNFRGVGNSTGEYDNGVGESQDMIALARAWQKAVPDVSFIFAGFSFGSYVAYRAASHFPNSMLITIAPPVHHYNYLEFNPKLRSWLVVQGLEDEVVPAQLVFDFVQNSQPPIALFEFSDTTHFFHGKLIELKTRLTDYICTEAIDS